MESANERYRVDPHAHKEVEMKRRQNDGNSY